MCEKKPVDKEKSRCFLRKNLQKTAKIRGFIPLKQCNIVHNDQEKKRNGGILMQNAEKVHTAQINVAAVHTISENCSSPRAKSRPVAEALQGIPSGIHVFLHLCCEYVILYKEKCWKR